MKKLLLILGFLPVIAFANVAEKISPKQALIEELDLFPNQKRHNKIE